MPRNASGTYTLPTGNPVVSGDIISSTWANDTMGDLASAITNSLARDGAGGMTAALRVVDGSVSVPGLGFANETGSGLYRSAAGDVGLAILGNQILRMRSTGLDVTGALGVSGTTTLAAASATNLSYTGTLTGGTGVINIGSGQVYKDASGNVGIGTSSPAFPLDVQSNSSAYAINLRGRSSDNISILNFVNNANSVTYGQIDVRSNLMFVNAYANIPMLFGTNNTERMRIDFNGNLLVGTTTTGGWSGNQRLAVEGGAWNIGAYQNASSLGVGCFLGRVENINAAFTSWYYGSSFVGSITTNGTATSYNTTSDYRLKESISPMTGALAKNDLLNPVTYKWKADGSDGQGFIAHELQAVFPDAVTGEKDAVDDEGNPKYQGVDTSFLVGHLVACIKELKAEVDTLKTTIH